MIPRLLLALVALAFSACSTSFDAAWARAQPGVRVERDGRFAGAPRGTRPSRFDGRWSGRWTSDYHHAPFSRKPAGGEMHLVLTRSAPRKYSADVRAHWLVFRGDYQVLLDGQEHGGALRLGGVQYARAIFGGPYRYDAVVTPTHFTMRYDSRYDRGKVELVR